jgi:hypothetical protein
MTNVGTRPGTKIALQPLYDNAKAVADSAASVRIGAARYWLPSGPLPFPPKSPATKTEKAA